jgi:hypothetical protein
LSCHFTNVHDFGASQPELFELAIALRLDRIVQLARVVDDEASEPRFVTRIVVCGYGASSARRFGSARSSMAAFGQHRSIHATSTYGGVERPVSRDVVVTGDLRLSQPRAWPERSGPSRLAICAHRRL